MPLVVLAGVSQAVVTRHKRYEISTPGWTLVRCDSRTTKSDLRTCWKDVVRYTEDSGAEGAHILAFHHRDDERDLFEDDIYSRHRLVWVDRMSLGFYGSNAFDQFIQRTLQFESVWRAGIRPTIDSPLMLPETCFHAHSIVKEVWVRAHRLGIDNDDINAVNLLIKRFRQDHHDRGCWIDGRSHRFTPAEAKHGLHVDASRRHKFTYEIPKGFHFDVRASNGREFTIRDHTGASWQFRRYTNVDSHGHMRGGE